MVFLQTWLSCHLMEMMPLSESVVEWSTSVEIDEHEDEWGASYYLNSSSCARRSALPISSADRRIYWKHGLRTRRHYPPALWCCRRRRGINMGRESRAPSPDIVAPGGNDTRQATRYGHARVRTPLRAAGWNIASDGAHIPKMGQERPNATWVVACWHTKNPWKGQNSGTLGADDLCWYTPSVDCYVGFIHNCLKWPHAARLPHTPSSADYGCLQWCPISGYYFRSKLTRKLKIDTVTCYWQIFYFITFQKSYFSFSLNCKPKTDY